MKKIYIIIIVQLCAILSFAQNWNVTMMRVTRLTTSQGCTDAFGSPDYGWGLRTTTSYYDSDIDNGWCEYWNNDGNKNHTGLDSRRAPRATDGNITMQVRGSENDQTGNGCLNSECTQGFNTAVSLNPNSYANGFTTIGTTSSSGGGYIAYYDLWRQQVPNPNTYSGYGYTSGQWTVLCYDNSLGYGTDWDYKRYSGYYLETTQNLNINTTSRWASGGSPSDASGYAGLSIGADNHAYRYKRQGFTCGSYRLDFTTHDDDTWVYVDGVLVFSHVGGCCDAHTGAWAGYLTANSTVEVRVKEGGGGSEVSFNLVPLGNLSVTATTTNETCTYSDNGAIDVTLSGGITGVQYIKVIQNKADFMNLAEIRALELFTGNNIALSKSVTTSSNYDATNYPPAELVDGVVNTTNNMWHSNSGVGQYAEINLGATYNLDKIQIYNRSDCCYDRADNLIIQFKNSSGAIIYTKYINANNGGGATPFEVNVLDASWSDGGTTLDRTGLNAGTYTLTYNDAGGCSTPLAKTITVTANPVGQTNSNPIAIGTLLCSTNYSNVQNNAATNCFNNALPAGTNQSSDDIWYSFVLSSPATINLSHCGSGFDTYIHLLNSSLGLVSENDDSGPLCASTESSIRQSLAAGTYYIVSEGYNTNSGSINTQLQIQVPTGGSISGTSNACVGATGITYTISGVSFATDYNWTVPSGATITAGQGTTTITVSYSSVLSGDITCTPRTYGGTCLGTTSTFSVTVNAQPTSPSLNTATPASGTSICQGQNVNATITAGTGGVSGVDVYEYSIDGGSTWSTYSSGNTITTTTASTSVQIRVSRTSSGSGCTSTTPTVIATWPITIQPTSPTLNTATPASGTPICQGDNVSATITAGTGGFSASDVYEYSTDGGSTWTTYTSGNNINTSTATTSVQVQVSRTSGTGTGCNATTPTVIATWPIRTGGTHVVLASNTTNGSTLPQECENGGWTYYADPSDPDKWLFAIEWGINNSVPKAAADVKITKLGSNIYDEQIRAPHSRTDASYVMSRYWNVTTSTLVDPVNVRFYYDPAEITSITAQRDAQLTALNTATPGSHFAVSFEWFKTVGIPFTNTLIADGNNFNFNYISLTPASTGTENGVSYVQFDGITSFSGGSGGVGLSPHSATPLPVTYTSIIAKPIKNEYIQVSWVTASEINNKGFEVERSIDGINFEKIGFVAGNNNTTQSKQYVYNDRNVEKGREYYYRLNQIDNDEKSSKSKTVSAYLIRNTTTTVGNFYPNPTTQQTNIEIIVNEKMKGSIRILNSLGQEVLNMSNDLVVGVNTIHINTNSLASGIYVANIDVGGEIVKKNIVVTK